MNPDLRGKKYQKRQESRKVYIKEIKEFELAELRKKVNGEKKC